MKPQNEESRIMNVAIRWRISYQDAKELIDTFEKAQTIVKQPSRKRERIEEILTEPSSKRICQNTTTSNFLKILSFIIPYILIVYC